MLNRPIPLLAGALWALPSWPAQQLPAFVLPWVAHGCYGCCQQAWAGMQAGPAFQLSTVLPYPVSKKQLVQGGSPLALQRPMLIIWMSDVLLVRCAEEQKRMQWQDGHRFSLQLEHLYWHWAGNCAFCGSISRAIAHRA